MADIGNLGPEATVTEMVDYARRALRDAMTSGAIPGHADGRDERIAFVYGVLTAFVPDKASEPLWKLMLQGDPRAAVPVPSR